MTTKEPDSVWDYYNTINAYSPDTRKHTGSNKTPKDKAKKKNKTKRYIQKKSRKNNR